MSATTNGGAVENERVYRDLLDAKKLCQRAWCDTDTQWAMTKVIHILSYLDRQAGEIARQACEEEVAR